MKTRLVVLIDFTPHAGVLLRFADSWSRATGAEILVVHQVLRLSPNFSDSGTKEHLVNMDKADALANLKELVRQTLPGRTDIKYCVTDQHLPFYMPVLLGHEFNDFLITGLKGTGFLKKLIFGSTTLELLEELSYTHIAVPLQSECRPATSLILATHYDYPLNEEAFLNFCQTFAGTIKEVELIAVAATDENPAEAEKYLTTIKEKTDSIIPGSVAVFQSGDSFNKIKTYVSNRPGAILAVQEGPRSITDQLFRKFLINDLIYEGSLPFIIFPS